MTASARVPAIRTLGRRGAYAGVAFVLVAVAVALPRLGSAVAGVETPATSAAQASRTYALPPLSAYAAAFEWQAPYPTAVAETEVNWIIALRNTGTADWFSDRAGARVLLALEDGTAVATTVTAHVAPGDVGVFNTRFIAPATPGVHTVRFRILIEGTGTAPDLGLYTNITVTARRSPTGGRH